MARTALFSDCDMAIKLAAWLGRLRAGLGRTSVVIGARVIGAGVFVAC